MGEEIDGVDPALNRRWSARRRSIEQRQAELATDFQAVHGRPPTAIETLALAQQANLETRQDKHEPRSLAEQRATWRAEAEAVLGADGVRTMLAATLTARTPRRPVFVTRSWVRTQSAQIVATMEGSRSTWQDWHVRAEALRIVRAANVPRRRVDDVVARLTHAALTRHSIALQAPADGIAEPAALRRVDGVVAAENREGTRRRADPALAAGASLCVDRATGARDCAVLIRDRAAMRDDGASG